MPADDFAGVVGAWTLDPNRPRLISPTGRVQRMARSRDEAIHVIRTVVESIREADPTFLAAVQSAPLHDLFRRILAEIRDEGEAVEGASLAQLLDILLWGLEWSDVAGEVARA